MPSLRWSNVGLILQLGFVTVLSPTLELFCYGRMRRIRFRMRIRQPSHTCLSSIGH